MCPPPKPTNSKQWRSLNDIHKKTFRFFDLLNFCQTFGAVLGVEGYANDVKVNFDPYLLEFGSIIFIESLLM
jgi:hypothetical protein